VYPQLAHRREDGLNLPVLVWRPERPVLTISSGVLGGGIGVRHWVVNATVPMSYARPDPYAHLVELAAGLGLPGPGTGLLTGVDVARLVTVDDDGVTVSATVGIADPTWAAAPLSQGPLSQGPLSHGPLSHGPDGAGTINVVAWVPARLSEPALVNVVATVAEAKAQALAELAVPGTGTCTDATVVCCPPDGPRHWYGGPRSTWGARLARAVHAAVVRGGRDWLADPRPWSVRHPAGPLRGPRPGSRLS
jgi:adenosylcobinamide amidohydrolase